MADWTIDDLLTEIRPEQERVRLLLDGRLSAALADARTRLAEATARSRTLEDPELEAAQGDFDRLQADAAAAEREFVFDALPATQWDRLLVQNAPTAAQKKDEPRLGWNPDTFPAAAMAASCSQPGMTPDQAQQLIDRLSTGQFTALWQAVLRAQGKVTDAGKARVSGTGQAASSEPGSITAAPEESR